MTKSLAGAGRRHRGGERPAAALAVELEHEVRLRRHLEQAQRHLVDAARGAARERLVAQHPARPQVDDRLEDGAELVGQQHLLQVAPVLQVVLRALDVHAGPRLLHQAGDEPLRHDERVVEGEGEAHRHAAQRAEVGAREAHQLAVEVDLHAVRGRLEVGDPERALPALRGEEDQEGVAAAVVDADDVLVADLVSLQLEDEVAGHAHDLLEDRRAVLVLDLGEGRRVDQQEPQAALLGEHLAQVLDPLPVGNGGLVRAALFAGAGSEGHGRVRLPGPAGGHARRRCDRLRREHAVSPAALGLVQRLVRRVEQPRGVEPVERVLGHPAADADAPERLLLREGEGVVGEQAADLLRRRHALRRVRVGQDEQELLAPEAAEDVVLAHGVVHEAGQLLQELVAGEVAVRVVVVLEVVDVEQEHGERLRGLRLPRRALVVGGAGGAVDELVERLVHVLLVVDPGEAVHLRRRLHPADLVGGVQHLRARLGHEPQRRLGVAGLPRLRDHDDAERLLVEHQGGDEVRLGHAGEPRARLDAALRGLGLEVLAVHVDLGLGGEADLARVERHLGPHLDRRAVRVGRGHDQPRRPGPSRPSPRRA